MLKSQSSLNHTANLPKIKKKDINFKEKAVSVSQIIEIVRQRGFTGCKNCPGIWMPCISEQKVGRLGEDQH